MDFPTKISLNEKLIKHNLFHNGSGLLQFHNKNLHYEYAVNIGFKKNTEIFFFMLSQFPM